MLKGLVSKKPLQVVLMDVEYEGAGLSPAHENFSDEEEDMETAVQSRVSVTSSVIYINQVSSHAKM